MVNRSRVPRFSIEASGLSEESFVDIPPERTHHLTQVLRLETGHKLEVLLLPDDELFLAELVLSDGKHARAKLLEKIEVSNFTGLVASLGFALCKGKKNDLVCQKLTELGVERIIFWQSDHSVQRLKSKADIEKKLQRWNRVVEEACGQSKQLKKPELLFAKNIEEYQRIIEKISDGGDRRFYCALGEDALSFQKLEPPRAQIHLLIGPEGDFSAKEEELCRASGFCPLDLGPYVLRSETAAISAVAGAFAIWGHEGRKGADTEML